MGKSKAERTLTHEEIWDDSALVQSWDEAVEEYKLYHSIHARGENVEDVLREAEAADMNEEGDALDEEDAAAEEETIKAMSGQADDQTFGTFAQKNEPSGPMEPPVAEGSAAAPSAGPAFPTGAMPMPAAVLSNVQDENLKRLMMSWYFAGYYTGFYEGQQQANQSKG